MLSPFSLKVVFTYVTILCLTPSWCLLNRGLINSRDYYGDTFKVEGNKNCTRRACNSNGKRQSDVLPGSSDRKECLCRCSSKFKTFRDDTYECVQEINGCYHAVFETEQSLEKIPFVILPTSGKILHPSATISIPDVVQRQSNKVNMTCKVTNITYLTGRGWEEVLTDKNEKKKLFEFYDDANKHFLKWKGKEDHAEILASRIVRAMLLCTRRALKQEQEVHSCITFRISGNSLSGSATRLSEDDDSETSRPNNYIIIGLSIGFLGLMYVIAVFIFISVRKRRIQAKKLVALQAKMKKIEESNKDDDIKNDHQYDTLDEIGTSQSLTDRHGESRLYENKSERSNSIYSSNVVENFQEAAPEENVCIEESSNNSKLEMVPRDEDSSPYSNNKVVHSRSKFKRIYFNPAFFERDLLLNPPPAAEEFICKIQEMIGIAKSRLKNKKYVPKLHVVPEDDYFYFDLDDSIDNSKSGDNITTFQNKSAKSMKTDVSREPLTLKSPTAKEIPANESIEKVIQTGEKSNFIKRVPPANFMDGLKPYGEESTKTRKKCIPPPPPPPPPPTVEPNVELPYISSKPKMPRVEGIKQFDLFRKDLERKIQSINAARQNIRMKSLKSEDVDELPPSKSLASGNTDDNSSSATDKKPSKSDDPSLKETSTADFKYKVNRSKAFKFNKNNSLYKSKATDKQTIINEAENVESCYENLACDTIKLDLTYEDVPKTTIHVSGVECDRGIDSDTNILDDYQSKEYDLSSNTSDENTTVIQISDGQNEANSDVESLNNRSIVYIKKDSDNVQDMNYTRSNADSHANSTQFNDSIDSNDTATLYEAKNTILTENLDDNNLSSDSAIEDTSMPSSPVDSNSEKSVVISGNTKKEEVGVDLCGSKNSEVSPYVKQNNNEKVSMPGDRQYVSEWLKFSNDKKFSPIEKWLETSENYSSSAPDEQNLDSLNGNETESLDSVLSDVSSSNCSNTGDVRPLPMKRTKRYQIAAMKDASQTNEVVDLHSGNFSDKSLSTMPSVKTCGNNASIDSDHGKVKLSIQEWLINGEKVEDDDKEIIPHFSDPPSEFRSNETLYKAQPSSIGFLMDVDDINPVFSNLEEKDLDCIDGKKLKSRKNIRRKVAKNKSNEVARSKDENSSTSDSDHSREKRNLLSKDEKLLVAQETLLDQIAQTLNKSDICSTINVHASLIENSDRNLRANNVIDKAKLETLLNSRTMSGETML